MNVPIPTTRQTSPLKDEPADPLPGDEKNLIDMRILGAPDGYVLGLSQAFHQAEITLTITPDPVQRKKLEDMSLLDDSGEITLSPFASRLLFHILKERMTPLELLRSVKAAVPEATLYQVIEELSPLIFSQFIISGRKYKKIEG